MMQRHNLMRIVLHAVKTRKEHATMRTQERRHVIAQCQIQQLYVAVPENELRSGLRAIFCFQQLDSRVLGAGEYSRDSDATAGLSGSAVLSNKTCSMNDSWIP